MKDRLLTPREAAQKLAVSRWTIYHWANDRRIATVKLFNGALRFRESDIDRLIAQSTQPALRSLEKVA